MRITRTWAMPSKDTFKIRPIDDLLFRYGVGEGWIDPFAGKYSRAEWTNDLNPDRPTKYHMHAEDFCNLLTGPFKGCLFDPPYSLRQIKEVYESIGLQFSKSDGQVGTHFARVKDALKDKCEYVISFGWNSSGFGKTRGFEIIEILLVNHGGNGHHDTIVTVERKNSL